MHKVFLLAQRILRVQNLCVNLKAPLGFHVTCCSTTCEGLNCLETGTMVNIFHKIYKNESQTTKTKDLNLGDDICEDDNLLLEAEPKLLLRTDRGLTSEPHLSRFCSALILTVDVITNQTPYHLCTRPNLLHENYKALSHFRNPSALHFVIWPDLGVAMTLHSQTSNLLQPLHHRRTISARCHGDCRE